MTNKDAKKLLNLSAELVIALRSRGEHYSENTPWIGAALEDHILKLRQAEKKALPGDDR